MGVGCTTVLDALTPVVLSHDTHPGHHSLQRFKSHLAGAVVSVDNAALDTMAGTSVMDLFLLGGGSGAAGSGKGAGTAVEGGGGGGSGQGGGGGGGGGSGSAGVGTGPDAAVGLQGLGVGGGSAAAVLASLDHLWSSGQYDDLSQEALLASLPFG